MPTIDQLAPAAAASDADMLVISQNGVSRRIARASLLAGVQPQIALPPASLLGNSGATTSAATQIAIGSNLSLSGGTLSAHASPYSVPLLPSGTVPQGVDLVPLGQSTADKAVSYAQFMSGLASLPNIDASNLTIQYNHASTPVRLSDLANTTAQTTGATMTGSLSLSADPTQPLHAATKSYVDSATASLLPTGGGTMRGAVTLAADPAQPLQAATKQYLDGRVQRVGDVMTGALTLASDPTLPLHASSKQYVDNRIQRAGDMMAGPLSLSADPSAPLHASTKQYVDARISRAGDAMSGPLTLSADPASPLQASTKQYVDARIQRSGDVMSGALTLASDPAQPLHAATKQYVDAAAALTLSSNGGSLRGPLIMAGTGQNKVQNGSFYVGNSDFQHAVLSPSGPQTALFNKVGSTTSDANVVQSYYLVTHNGGTGHVINNLSVGTTISSTPADGVWGLLSSLTSSSGGGNGGLTGHVAGYFQTVRAAVPAPSSTITSTATGTSVHIADVTNCFTGYTSGTGYPLSSAHPLPLLINGNSYSAVACVPDTAGATSGPGTLTLSAAISPTDGAVGKPVIGVVNGANLWGGVIEYHEQVDLPSSKSGFGQTLELDWVGNNVDDADSRCVISAVIGKNVAGGTDVEIGNVIGVWPGNGSTRSTGVSIKRGMQVNLAFSQAVIDTRNATQRAGANALWFADGQTIAFSSDGKWALRYNSSRPGLEFLLNGGVLGSIDTLSRYNAPGGFVSGGSFATTTGLASGQAGFDARAATQATGANMVWLSDGHRISLSSDGTRTIYYDNATSSITLNGPTRFNAAPILPNFTVATLPAAPVPGAKAYVTNGRKNSETTGGGSGVEVFSDSSGRWISVVSGAPVQA